MKCEQCGVSGPHVENRKEWGPLCPKCRASDAAIDALMANSEAFPGAFPLSAEKKRWWAKRALRLQKEAEGTLQGTPPQTN